MGIVVIVTWPRRYHQGHACSNVRPGEVQLQRKQLEVLNKLILHRAIPCIVFQ